MKLFGPYKKRSRSASMQLSINAIVILVMAMAVLGLGLGLIRGVLSQGSKKLEKAIGQVNLDEVASADKQIANADTIEVKLRDEQVVAISFYNSGADCTSEGNEAYLRVGCKIGDSEDIDFETFWKKANVLQVPAERGEPTRLGGIFETNSSITTGMYPCRVDVVCGVKPNTGTPGEPNIVKSAPSFIEVTA